MTKIPHEYYGSTLDETVVKSGLQELNPDIHFDMGAALNKDHPMMGERQGVFYKGKHICSMDRGQLPEFAVYNTKVHTVKVPIGEVRAREVAVPDAMDPDQCWVRRPRRWKCLRVGWRHTFEKLIRANIPGVTHEAIAAKFNVPIKFFTGEKEALEVA